MSQIVSRIWAPVKRNRVETYLQLMLLSFAASVCVTRMILELTGYPQLGNSTLHIAHVLYGGVLLFAGSLLPIIYANRWALTWGAILSGLGIGLFIDEVGKFITQSNDYFYPAAAPIIYAFFLVTTLLYLKIRKEPTLDARGELYAVLDTLGEVLDHSLEPEEHEDMRLRLGRILEKTSSPSLRSLAVELMDFIESDTLQVAPEKPNLFDRVIDACNMVERRYCTRGSVKAFLVISLILLGIPSFLRFIDYNDIAGDTQLREEYLAAVVSDLPSASHNAMFWATMHIVLDGAVGLALALSASMLFLRRDRWGVELGSAALLVSLLALNVLLFYIEQFSTVVTAVYQYATLQGLYYYQRKHAVKTVKNR
ncbi:hypothetical protein JXL21_06285 [Candidatus Bathyarchaeota archaeon]|nr:hypothetical protein [Candidatus Bathyarchaeota archaeon]